MIKSGRNLQRTPPCRGIGNDCTSAAKLTAIIGGVVFAVFLCLSVHGETDSRDVSATFGEGAYQVFAPTDAPIGEEASTVKDDDIWAYLESLMSRLIYGE